MPNVVFGGLFRILMCLFVKLHVTTTTSVPIKYTPYIYSFDSCISRQPSQPKFHARLTSSGRHRPAQLCYKQAIYGVLTLLLCRCKNVLKIALRHARGLYEQAVIYFTFRTYYCARTPWQTGLYGSTCPLFLVGRQNGAPPYFFQ